MTRAPNRSCWRRATAWLLLVAFQLGTPGVALAAPKGERVVKGKADFLRNGHTTRITTHTRRTIVNYTNFDILRHEAVRIDQPTANSRILNRVLATDPTYINGKLVSNGQVWVVNPIGVYVGDQAIVDVGGLVAAAGNVRNQDFLKGRVRFRNVSGDVEVAEGATIRAADQVLLIGEHVANYGTITSSDGMIALVAGDKVRLSRVGGRVVVRADSVPPDPERFAVVQAGTLDAGDGQVRLTAGDAYSLAMNHTGITRAHEIHAEGGDEGLVQVAGTLDASGRAPGETGGKIRVLGELVAVGDATLDASGDVGGGEILVGGDFQGQGETRTARRTFVAKDALLRADAETEGDGGTIIVWADDATAFYGTLSARGGSESGDGGFAEISGKRSLVSHGSLDLGADNGSVGTVLYDPLRIVIRGGPTDQSVMDGSDFGDAGDFLLGDPSDDEPDGLDGQILIDDLGSDADDPFVIYESEIEGTDANILLQASRSIQTEGTFDHIADPDAPEGVGVVVIQPGRNLQMEMIDGGGEQGSGDVLPGEFTGIDIRTSEDEFGGDLALTWRLSEGGTLLLATDSASTRDAEIIVGTVETQGVLGGATNSVGVFAQGRGNVAIDRIVTSGIDAPDQLLEDGLLSSRNAGNVTVLATSGTLVVGSVEAIGGDAIEPDQGVVGEEIRDSLGLGGSGGRVILTARNGPVTVDTIDVSGGDGTVREVELSDGATFQGQGGQGGTISLISDLDPNGAGSPFPNTEPRVVTVTGDLSARGGLGLGSEVVEEPPSGGSSGSFEVFGAPGGRGGQIFVTAGYVADGGSVVLGSQSQPIVIDASGGDGTAGGGFTAAGGASEFSGASIGAIRVEAHDDVETHARLIATGGNAGIGAGTDPVSGGLGGVGGSVSLGSDTGNVTVNAMAGGATVVTDGGDGRIDPARVLDDGVPRFNGQGGSAGDFTVEAGGEGAAIMVFGDVSANGGDGTAGSGGAGGAIRIDTADGEIQMAAITTNGGSGTGSVSEDDGANEAQGVLGGNGGSVAITTRELTTDDAQGGGDVLLGGRIETLGGAGEAAPDGDIEDPNENHGVGGTVASTLR